MCRAWWISTQAEFYVFKQRQAYSAIPPTAFSVSQTAVDKWDQSEDDGVGCLHCQQPKKAQLPLVSQKSKWYYLQRISSSQNKNLFVIVLL